MIPALDLLSIEITSLFSPTGLASKAGRQLVVASATDGIVAVAAPTLPPDLSDELADLVRRSVRPRDLMQPPAVLSTCQRLLDEVVGKTTVLPESGPSYLVTGDLRGVSEVRIVRSDDGDAGRLELAHPGNWDDDDWSELLGGWIGPWAMALIDNRVASLCHTAVMTEVSAEAGTWTHPRHRGRGLAAATTTEWASILRPTGRALFYSTSITNRSSQRVAERLGLPLLGSLWWLG